MLFSDLDGDEYFVCWDDRLIPKAEHPPMKPTVKQSIKRNDSSNESSDPGPITINHIIRQFADCDPQMGLINNLYMKWADEFGANCTQCKGLFSNYDLGPAGYLTLTLTRLENTIQN